MRSMNVHQTLHEIVLNLGVDQSAVSLAQACTKLAMKSIQMEPTLLPYIQKLTFDKSSYLSTHSVLLAQIACIIASHFGWSAETTQFKLAFSAILHDLTIQDNATALMELSADLDQKMKNINDPKIKAFREHPNESAVLLQKIKNVPSDVDSIIRNHHERPNGTGFPNHSTLVGLNPLASLFIIAHDLTNYIWLRGPNSDLNDFIHLHKKNYTFGIFKKFLSSYKSEAERALEKLIK